MAILPLIATPGASLALLIQHVTDSGRRQALPVILGTVTGLYIHATLAVAGLSALVMRSSLTFTAVKFVGAVYLIGPGVWTWRSATPNATPAPRRRRVPKRVDSVYAQALLPNVLNPKAGAVYLRPETPRSAGRRGLPAALGGAVVDDAEDAFGAGVGLSAQCSVLMTRVTRFMNGTMPVRSSQRPNTRA
ncbi:LysE family translocator [Streptomyces sp. NBC_00059]|nr:LysE family translocator [Streptomyces sp. NBC_00059]